jgi:glutamate-1-semialdehyde 2,1-aminomutase
VLWPPSQFECAFLSTAHTEVDVDRTLAAFAAALRRTARPLVFPAP